MSKSGGNLTVQYNLRWAEELRDKVASAAKENTRSMNAEIIHRLEQSFLADGGISELHNLPTPEGFSTAASTQSMTASRLVANDPRERRRLAKLADKAASEVSHDDNYIKETIISFLEHLHNSGIGLTKEEINQGKKLRDKPQTPIKDEDKW